MPVKTVIDGNLLADCQKIGQIRFGMLRVAEEITKRLINNDELDLSFANIKLTLENDKYLRSYLSGLTSNKKLKTLSFPFAGININTIEKISAKLSRKISPESIQNLSHYNLFHSFYHPFSKAISKNKIKKSITLLDIIPLRMDGYDNLVPELKKIVESVVPNFAIAISNYSKLDICDYDKRINPEKVFVVPLAANKELFYVNRNKEQWNVVKKKYGLPDNYFLSVSGIDKRKNLEHLIYSFDRLVLQENTNDLHLVMTGNSSFENFVFRQLNIHPKTKSKIVFAKPIEEEDLSIVYSNALCFFFMSTYEGFGLPALEAMQCGTPVITSNATSLPEVVGDAGIMLSPTNKDELCSAMLKVFVDSALRDKLSQLGLQRSKEFSWERCAKEYAGIFKRITN